MIDKDKLGLSLTESYIKSLGVQDGTRSRVIFKELNKLPDKESKKKLWNDYVKKKILTPEVARQVKRLLNITKK